MALSIDLRKRVMESIDDGATIASAASNSNSKRVSKIFCPARVTSWATMSIFKSPIETWPVDGRVDLRSRVRTRATNSDGCLKGLTM